MVSQLRVRPVSMISSTISTCAAGDVGVEVLEDPHDAAGLGAGAVGRDRHPVHLDVPLEAAGQVGHHHHGAAQDADDQEVLALVVGLDLAGQLAEAVLDLLLGEEHVDEVALDVADVHGRQPATAPRSRPGVPVERTEQVPSRVRRGPGRAGRPRPGRASRSAARRGRRTCSWNSSAARAPAAQRRQAQDAGVRTAGASSSERGHGKRVGRGRRTPRRRGRRGLDVRAQLVGGAGQGRRRRPAQLGLEQRQHRRGAPGTG